MTHTYLNGKLLTSDKAKISVADRGFRFGDGVFETMAVHAGVPYQWHLHEQRLLEGMSAIKLPQIDMNWQKAVKKLVHKNELNNGFVRISVSRGVGSAGYAPLTDNEPTLVMETIVRSASQANPATLWFSSYAKPSRHSLPVNHKIAQGLNSTLALMQARENGCDEALLLNHDGNLCEAASGNLFWLKDSQLYTPALDVGCLAGTTRDALIRFSPYLVKHCKARIDELKSADAVFISNCNWGVRAVQSLAPQGWCWTNHRCVARLQALYEQDIRHYVSEHADDWR